MEKINLSGVNGNNLFDDNTRTSTVLDSGLYQGVLKYLYFTESASKAIAANLVIDINGLARNFTLWISYKNGVLFKENPQTHQKEYLSNYKKINALAFCATGKPLDQLTQEEKTIKIFNRETRKEEPTQAMCIVELINKPICIGLKKVNHHVEQKQLDGSYLPTDKTVFINDIDKFYNTEGKIAQEISSGSPREYADKWLKNNKGRVFEENMSNKTVVAYRDPKQGSSDVGTAGTSLSSMFGDD